MSYSTLLILGSDKISFEFLEKNKISQSTLVVLDRSSNLKRVFKLIFRKKISFFLLLKMFICAMQRKNFQPGKNNLSIRSNKELIKLIKEFKVNKVILFRAGLIINSKVLEIGIPILNIHCAKIPEYGGLGAISRALKDSSHSQEAVLHRVTTTIDEGEVLDRESYWLTEEHSYCKNENEAYKAGMKLLARQLT